MLGGQIFKVILHLEHAPRPEHALHTECASYTNYIIIQKLNLKTKPTSPLIYFWINACLHCASRLAK